MSLDPRTPVLVGIAQIEQRADDPRTAREPLELMVEALKRAAEDAGSPALLGAANSVRVIRGVWPYENPARVVAERIGAPRAQTVGTVYGGNLVQLTLNQSALSIARGALEVVVMTGAECGNTQRKARAAGIELAWSKAPGSYDLVLGSDEAMWHDAERARGLRMPIQFYPMFDNALRHARGETIEEQLRNRSELWASFSRVASRNPHAWIREPVSAVEIRTVSASNRPISFPYPKLMNSNSSVDQGAALILCSLEAARRFRVPEDRLVYPHAGTDAHDSYTVSTRDDLRSSPAIRVAGRRALELAGTDVTELAHVDVYSCFPCAVEVAAGEIGLRRDRPLTVTGGLTFAGGPLNNYVMHSIARMAELLREDRGKKGLITANGGFLTKHAFGVYSTEPPAEGFRHQDPQAEVDRSPRREAVVDHEGEVTVETYTVMYGERGPEIAHAACLLPDGRRTWANLRDADVVEAMTREEFCGRRGRIDGKGTLALG
jgi:acetyl-CoA C-acetyltransferase